MSEKLRLGLAPGVLRPYSAAEGRMDNSDALSTTVLEALVAAVTPPISIKSSKLDLTPGYGS